MECNADIALQPDGEAVGKRYLVRVLTLDRKEEKTFSTLPQLEETIKKANQFGCDGGKLLLAGDGCEVCDNEAYLYYILKGAKFMVAPSASLWQMADNSGDSPAQHPSVRDGHKPVCCRVDGPAAAVIAPPQQSGVCVAGHSAIEELPARLQVVVTPEEKFSKVDVPWHRIPAELREMLQAGEPLDQRLYTLGNLIVNELRLVSRHIPIRVLRLLAHRVVMRYPKSFQHACGLPSDLLSIVMNFALAMRQRNNYLNRTDATSECEWNDLSSSDWHVCSTVPSTVRS